MGNGVITGIINTLQHLAVDPVVGAVDRLFDLARIGGGLGDFLYYALIYKFVQYEIRSMGPDILARFAGVAVTVALTLMTIWILFQGYRILTGQSRDSLAAFAMTTAKTAFIIMFASTMSLFGQDIHTLMTDDLNEAIVELVTGEDNKSAAEMIEENMAFAQVALYSIDTVKIQNNGDMTINSEKTRAMWMAGFGAAGPAVTAGVILLMFEVAIALFIGFGPFFVLCLISDKTSSLFWKWLWYGIGTLFALGVFAAMTAIALKVMGAVTLSFWGSALLGGLFNANLTEGFTSVAIQQGGIGLLLTLLLVSVPPIAANFFQGALGAASTYNVFQGAGNGAAGVAPRAPGAPPQSVAQPTPRLDPGRGTADSWNNSGNQLSTQYGGSQVPQSTSNLGPGSKRADGTPV